MRSVDKRPRYSYTTEESFKGGKSIAKHKDKHIQAAIDYAISQGWTFVKGGKSAHCYAQIRCGNSEHGTHTMSIWSTPKSCENHAKQIRRKVNQCKK